MKKLALVFSIWTSDGFSMESTISMTAQYYKIKELEQKIAILVKGFREVDEVNKELSAELKAKDLLIEQLKQSSKQGNNNTIQN